MPEFTVTIVGAGRFRAQMRSAPLEAAKDIGLAVMKSLYRIERNVKTEAPVNKGGGGGNLRQSIRTELLGPFKGSVTAYAGYAGYVEGGTRPHVIRPLTKQALSFPWSRGGFQAGQSGGKAVFVKPGLTKAGRIKYHGNVVFSEVHHPGTKANPFFQRGIDKTLSEIVTYFEEAMARLCAFVANG